jgi:hypothetical protein
MFGDELEVTSGSDNEPIEPGNEAAAAPIPVTEPEPIEVRAEAASVEIGDEEELDATDENAEFAGGEA